MLLSPRKHGLDSLFEEVRVFKDKETHINNLRVSQGGGPGGRFRGPSSFSWCHFSSKIHCTKEF